jgi:hypothetical protein
MSNEERERWQLQKLMPIANYLTGEPLALYHRLLEKYKAPEHPEFKYFSWSWHGPTSPLSMEQLAAMTPHQVLEYLKTWEIPQTEYAPSPEGLARILREVVAARAQEFSAIATEIEVDQILPTYLAHFINGLEDGLKNNQELNWENVLELCIKICADDSLSTRMQKGQDFETGLEGVYMAIGNLMRMGMNKKKGISISCRTTVWKIINTLTTVQDSMAYMETPDREYGAHSPISIAINTAGGVATLAVFEYLLWLKNSKCLTSDNDGQYIVPTEVGPVLDQYLDRIREPHKTIHAIIGQYLNMMYSFFPHWVSSEIDRILPQGDASAGTRNAFFQGYFGFSDVWMKFVEKFPRIYLLGLNWALDEDTERDMYETKNRYVDHLMSVYVAGIVPLDDEHSLIRRFFKMAKPEMRKHAFDYIGRTMGRIVCGHPESKEQIERLKKLWEYRLALIKAATKKTEYLGELYAFGWWFALGPFEVSWLLDNLFECLCHTNGNCDRSNDVLTKLDRIAPEYPEKVASIVEVMINGDEHGFSQSFWVNELQKLFSTIKSSGNDIAWAKIAAIINKLGERGIRNYAALLD